jgi:hypothetical protein
MPGTPEKIQVLRWRASRKLPLFHPDDGLGLVEVPGQFALPTYWSASDATPCEPHVYSLCLASR